MGCCAVLVHLVNTFITAISNSSLENSLSFRQPIPLNAAAIEAGLVESLCRAVVGTVSSRKIELHSSGVEVPLTAHLHGGGADVLLHATLALACLAYEDRSSAAVVASKSFSEQSAVTVTNFIMEGFSRSSSPSPTRSTIHSAPATTSTYFTSHSAHLIALLALLVCHDPGLNAAGVEHRHVLAGDSAVRALQLLAGAWPYLLGESRRWAAIAVCYLLPSAVQTSGASESGPSTSLSHVSDAHSKSAVCAKSDFDITSPSSHSPPLPKLSQSLSILPKSPPSPRLFLNIASGSSSSPMAQKAAAAANVVVPPQLPLCFPEPFPLDRMTMAPNDHGITSALHSYQYARFHPLLTFTMRLQVMLFMGCHSAFVNTIFARHPRTQNNRASPGAHCCACRYLCKCWPPLCPSISGTLLSTPHPHAPAPLRNAFVCCASQRRRHHGCGCFAATRFTSHALACTLKE